MKNLIIRTITGAIFVAAIIASAIYSPFVFAILMFLMAMLGHLEFQRMIVKDPGKTGIGPGLAVGAVVYSLFPLYTLYNYIESVFWYMVPLLLLLILYYAFFKGKDRWSYISGGAGGVLFVVIPMGILNLYLNPTAIPEYHTPWLILGMFIILWTHDTFAYLTGSFFGKHPLYQRISPKKTIEGSIGGFGFAIIAAYIISIFSPMFSMWQWISFAFIIAVFGTLGDLAESWLKRRAGVKDSGKLLPGHGGILDRFDSLLIVSPIIYLLILIYLL